MNSREDEPQVDATPEAGPAHAEAADVATKWFVRYREHRDGTDLERALLRCAPALLRVARIWVGDDAEDLVQEVFVVAIREVETFDGGRALQPWLLGILRNLARAQRRRRRARPAVVEERADESGQEPAAVVDRRQWLALVANEIEKLPEPYHSVLTRHLVGGEPAFEIAAKLQRSPSTVRTQLERGLRELRRRLPAPLLAGLGAILVSRSAAAGSAVPVPPRRLRSGLIAGAVLALAWFAWLQVPASPSPTNALAAAGPRANVPPAASTVSNEPDPAVRTVAADAGADVRVRLRNADGTPLEGVPVVLDPRFVRGLPLTHAQHEWRIERSDPQGLALFRGVPPGNAALRLHDQAVLHELAVGSADQSLEFFVQPATTLLVKLVDAAQAPIAGGTVYLSFRDGDGTTPGYPAARTDAAGEARVVVVLPGSWLWATAPGHAVSTVSGPFTAAPASLAPELTVELDEPTTLRTGRVEDAEGRPLAGADVAAWSRVPRPAEKPMLFARSGPDGRFALEGLPPGAWAAAAGAPGHASARADLEADGEFALLRLPAGGDLEGRLLAMPLGRAPSLRVITKSAGEAGWQVNPFVSGSAAVAANGSFRIANLAQGEHFVALFETGNSTPLAVRRVAVHDRTKTAVDFGANVILPWEVQVQDENARPLPQCLVRATGTLPLVGSRHQQEARTDANGIARLARRDTCAQSLFAYLPRGSETNDVPAIELASVVPSARTVLTVPDSALRLGSVRGRLPACCLALRGTVDVELARAGGKRKLLVAADGAFTADELPAGGYRLLLHQRVDKVDSILVLAELELRPGEHHDLEPLGDPGFGDAVLVFGERSAASPVQGFLRDARGTVIEATHLDPGIPRRWRLFAGRYSFESPGSDLTLTRTSFEVRRDAETTVELARARGIPCRVEMEFDEGRADPSWLLATVTSTATGVSFDFVMPATKDARDWTFPVDLLPGVYGIAVNAPWGGVASGALVLGAGDAGKTFRFFMR